MLKKHALSIAEGSASFVLAALGGSTYRTKYASPSSLAAAALDGLFGHPAGRSDAVPDLQECCVALCQKGFSTTWQSSADADSAIDLWIGQCEGLCLPEVLR